jgi:hypothetical protein
MSDLEIIVTNNGDREVDLDVHFLDQHRRNKIPARTSLKLGADIHSGCILPILSLLMISGVIGSIL